MTETASDPVDPWSLAGVGHFRVDAARNLTYVSPEMERITGFSADEVIGKPCLTLIRCKECLRGCHLFDRGQIDDRHLMLYRKDGAEVEVVRSGAVERDDSGAITGAVETLRLADGEVHGGNPGRELDAVLGGLGRVWAVADASLRVVVASSALPAMLGLPAESLAGMPLSRLFGEELFCSSSEFRASVLEGKRREGWRASIRTATGQTTPVSLSVGSIALDMQCGSDDARFAVIARPDDEEEVETVPTFAGIVGRSAPMQRIFRLIELLHDNDATVLITGESGTGKELVARALHARSSRANGPFVAVNCAALPAELLESELFGHVRGAFTGAVRDRAGRFEAANGGTLFLDEIGDLAPALQVKLLRVLQERSFERVGDTRTRTADVRVIAATHVDLGRAVATHEFREDLYYRLRVVPIHVPPLRERRDDLSLLIPHLLHGIGRRRGRSLRLAPTAFRALIRYDWPGNVRELENALEYATALCEGQTIHLRDLPSGVAESDAGPHDAGTPSSGIADTRAPALPAAAGPRAAIYMAGLTSAEQAEAESIRTTLHSTRYRRSEAAALLGMSRTTLWRKMKQYRL